MKIAFVHDWQVNIEQEMDWADGLSAALAELEKRGHEVELFVEGEFNMIINNMHHEIEITPNIPAAVEEMKPDVILCWADLTRPNAEPLAKLGIPMAICFAGGATDGENLEFFDHFFVESKVYEEKFKHMEKSVSIAFGTNTELFRPTKQTKFFDTIFPATFARWKRHQLYAESVGDLWALAVGYMYDDHEQECWQICTDLGVAILPHVSAEVLKYLYAASKICVVPSESIGGSQRTVLEAMAMDIPVVVCDSDKFDFAKGHVFEAEPNPHDLSAVINASLEAEVNTREYIVSNWSEFTYADALEKGLKELLPNS